VIGARWIAAIAACGLAAACSPTDVVVATLGARGDGGAQVRPCGNDSQCHDEEFCMRDACDQGTGRCETRPPACELTQDLVCGCDGVTYWNDCLRQQVGMTAKTDGNCGPGAATCGGTAGTCPVAGASCARVYPSAERCPHDAANAPGVCVLLPPNCPPPGSERLAQCYGPAPGACDDECTAIRSEKPHLRPTAGLCP